MAYPSKRESGDLAGDAATSAISSVHSGRKKIPVRDIGSGSLASRKAR